MLKNRYRHTIFASYLGYIVQAIVGNFVPLLFLIFRESLGVPLPKITLLITLTFLIQLLVDWLSAFFVDKGGYRLCIVAAHFLAAAGLAGLAFFPSVFPDAWSGLLAAAVLYALGSGLIEVLISPIVEACPTENKTAAMSVLHSFYCWGTVLVILLSTLFLSVVGKESWRLLACLWALLPLVNAVYFLWVPLSRPVEEGGGMSVRELASKGLFWLIAVLMVAAGASEVAMAQWASAFVESGLGVSKAAGDLLGPCLFAALMGAARVVYAKFSEKVSLLVCMVGSGVLCVLAYLLTALSPLPAFSLIGCGLCGLSVGILWPGIFSLAAARFPRGGTTLFALLALAGDAGCVAGPALVGAAAGLSGGNIGRGLLTAVLFPLLLTAGALLYRRAGR
ncbi:MAG: MFS transporter [Clostridiales bacterium]|nr:MFS transporter [Clostridiales bacterium]